MITDKIRRKREERGYSQEYMASQIGTSTSAYQRLENGDTKLDLDKLHAIAKVLQVELLDLLTSESVVITTHDQKGGMNANVLHQNGVSEEVLHALNERYEAHVRELQQMNKRLLALLEQHFIK